MKIGFIGAGKAGFTLGKYFVNHQVEVMGYYSRNPESAKEAAEFTSTHCYDSMERIVEDSEQLFLTVPDGSIESVWNTIKLMPIKNKIICHCSGSLSSAIFSGIDQCDAFGYSIHPLFAIRDKRNSYKELSKAYFTIEGSNKHLEDMIQFVRSLGNCAETIAPEHKTKYHAAAVMASNQVNALVYQASRLLAECGLSAAFSDAAWKSLFLGNAQSICANGIVNSLTGPVERGDQKTIHRHLECLSGDARQSYSLLSLLLLEIAKEKHPDRNYEEMEKELKQDEEYSS